MTEKASTTEALQNRILELEQKCLDLETILEISANHADSIELELEKRNTLIQKIFGRYVANEVVEQLLTTPDGLRLGGERRLITILCSDLRGFTALSERLPAEDIIRILNYYLGAMADVIISYGGTVNTFLGDGILVYFGAPIHTSDHARKAIICALAMQAAMPGINRVLAEWGYPELEMGIGINTGEVVIGNVGSEQRAQYGAVGAAVNLAFRIESYSTGGEVLASEAARQAAGPGLQVARSTTVFPKGSRGPVPIFAIAGLDDLPQLALAWQEDALVDLAQPQAVTLAVLHEKGVSLEKSQALLHKLGQRSAVLSFVEPGTPSPAAFTNLRMELADGAEAYAKVKARHPDQDGFTIILTQLSPEAERWAAACRASTAQHGSSDRPPPRG